jgi:hemerythrin-like domain-containing protein
MNDPLRTLRNEHGSIAAILHGLQYLAQALRKPDVNPDLAVFRAMIYYIDQYPERQHHPKEDQWLFARLVERAPETASLVGELKAEHVVGAHMVRELEDALNRYEETAPQGANEFADTVDRYANFHWSHMRREEQVVLPLARKHLTDADLEEIEQAFAGHDDPVADLRDHDFDSLFARIVSIAPAPIGLNEPWTRPRKS